MATTPTFSRQTTKNSRCYITIANSVRVAAASAAAADAAALLLAGAYLTLFFLLVAVIEALLKDDQVSLLGLLSQNSFPTGLRPFHDESLFTGRAVRVRCSRRSRLRTMGRAKRTS